MKARDIEKRLEDEIPKLTDRFSREVSLVSITPSGTTATATTTAAHGKSIGDSVYVIGAAAPIEITSITRSGTTATAITATNHDLTENWFDTITIEGANEAEFNDTFDFKLTGTVPNRKKFTFQVADSGPASSTGSPLLVLPGSPFGYSGLVTITGVPSATSFTYELPVTLTEPANVDNASVVLGIRIYSAVTIERAKEVFETKDISNNQLVAFVVVGDRVVSRSRSALNDGVDSGGVSGDNRQQVLNAFSVLIFQKVTQSTSGADERDTMDDIERFMIRALVGWSPGTDFDTDSKTVSKFISAGVVEYTGAVYTHGVEFQFMEEIGTKDLAVEPFNVAFRDIAGSITTDQGDQTLLDDINLDDEPL